MAGIGQVKHVALFLRIEHQRILVGLFHRQQQLGDELLRPCLADVGAQLQFIVVLLQFHLQDGQRLLQVFFLQYSTCFDAQAHHGNKYQYQSFHSSFIFAVQRYGFFLIPLQKKAIILAHYYFFDYFCSQKH